MTYVPRHLRNWASCEHGSALILTMLILLVLSGLGMVALRSTTNSVQQSGAYRVRTQADTLSEAALEYTSTQASSDGQAATFATMMDAAQRNDLRASGPDEDIAKRKALHQIGPHVQLTQRPGDSSSKVTDFRGLNTTKSTTGLLGSNSFETGQEGVEFSVIIRDPLDGVPAPGYGDNYCFKKVTIASRAFVGKTNRDWSGAGMMGEKRNAMETFIGPVDCGSR